MINHYFKVGIESVLVDLRNTGAWINKDVHALYFPDMRHLMAWSFRPEFGNKITLIVGGKRQLSALSGLLDGLPVFLVDANLSVPSMKIYLKHCHDNYLKTCVSRGHVSLNFTKNEIYLLSRLLIGVAPRRADKQESAIKVRLMKKMDADNLVVLLIRLRLLLVLNSKFRQLAPARNQSNCLPNRNDMNGTQQGGFNEPKNVASSKTVCAFSTKFTYSS
ncbi:hypothetical protein F3J29_12830 [Enterobacter sp. Cy-643]|uniref:hypothetical protein n=1 Tax=Enterobacter sp. Cy-643 TaxID=2608346 RepID=UPI0014246DE3|nr:hypothetical protein [Enterobacter sp. Cy-643]NIF33015.1 hypothetical protein [Enterobacter sp. Cy-643]